MSVSGIQPKWLYRCNTSNFARRYMTLHGITLEFTPLELPTVRGE
jgi:hypothetical protein